MIVSTKRGAMVSGVLSQDPKAKKIGGKDTLVLNVRAQNYKDDSGNWHTLYVDVQCRDGLAERDGMYQKGDFVAAFGKELKSREYPEGSGKWYHNLLTEGLIPGDLVSIRWMQQVVDMIPLQPALDAESAPVPSFQEADPSPQTVYPGDDLERLIDETDEQDLPF